MDDRIVLVAILLLMGGDFLRTGIREYQIGYWLYKEGKRIEGRIFKIVRKGKGRHGTYYPVINFQLGEKVILKELAIGSSFGLKYKRGNKITVAYDPDHSEDCEIDDRYRLVTMPLIQFGFGLTLISIALYLLIIII